MSARDTAKKSSDPSMLRTGTLWSSSSRRRAQTASRLTAGDSTTINAHKTTTTTSANRSDVSSATQPRRGRPRQKAAVPYRRHRSDSRPAWNRGVLARGTENRGYHHRKPQAHHAEAKKRSTQGVEDQAKRQTEGGDCAPGAHDRLCPKATSPAGPRRSVPSASSAKKLP